MALVVAAMKHGGTYIHIPNHRAKVRPRKKKPSRRIRTSMCPYCNSPDIAELMGGGVVCLDCDKTWGL